MVDGKFSLDYNCHNTLLFTNGMVGSTLHEKSSALQFKKYTFNLWFHNDIRKFVYCIRGKNYILAIDFCEVPIVPCTFFFSCYWWLLN